MLLRSAPNIIRGRLHFLAQKPDFRAFYSPGRFPHAKGLVRVLVLALKRLETKKIRIGNQDLINVERKHSCKLLIANNLR
jgi:hypothetical protein